VDASVLFEVCRQAQQVFESQPVLLELNPPVVVCGDIHGQYVDLLRIFHQLGYPPTANYLFLGDYVDRGTKNLETIALLFCYKIKYPRNFFLLRGNHETAAVNAVYGFRQEIQRRFGRNEHGPLWRMFNEAFSQMPVTAIIGGEEINFQKQLRKIPRGWHDPGENRLALDLLWSDPDPTIRGWRPSPRGCSYLFGNDVLLDSCRQLDIDLIVRAHQVVQDGYEINPTQRLITVFSAPNYCGEVS
uniref:Serine/threonine-protein phosphatase n=1 Tax=Meloidogyne javanica TaxID=6303 RepID=A0A915LZ98_MELJA